MIYFPKSKINLGLYILCKRPDGYHDVATAMVPVGWSDILEIVPAKNGETTLTVTGRAVDCPVEKNLVMKGVKALADVVDVPPAEIHLHKVVPDGAGLGGGSADAAATIVGLNEVFNLGLSERQMADVAAKVGADCPFFIYSRPMMATGTGTELSPLELSVSGLWLVIAKPSTASVSTKEAYSAVIPHEDDAAILASELLKPVDRWDTAVVRNDFELPIFSLRPEIATLKERMLASGAIYAAMSGSGAAVFGIFKDDTVAERAAASFKDCESWHGHLI